MREEEKFSYTVAGVAGTYSRDQINSMRAGYEIAMVEKGYSAVYAAEKAANKFPLPKVTRPRTVKIHFPSGTTVYQVRGGEGGVLMRRSVHASGFIPSTLTANHIRELAKLLDNPTEEVEDDGCR